jgi:serine/threonine protein phosphatase PrpC
MELTSDHQPRRPEEAACVRAAGGLFLHKRVMSELAITRAFGDKSVKIGIKATCKEDAGPRTSKQKTLRLHWFNAEP